MEREEILKVLAPCGLNCRRCLCHENGDIKKLSLALREALGRFDTYAERFSKFQPAFGNYPHFKELPEFFTTGDCAGCRSGQCRFPGCRVNGCTAEKGIDFCFQCGEFPCDRSGLDENLKQRWIRMNRRMQEIGVEAFHAESLREPRYV